MIKMINEPFVSLPSISKKINLKTITWQRRNWFQNKKEQKILDKISIHICLDFAQLLWTLLLRTHVLLFLILVNCLYVILPPKANVYLGNIRTEHQTPVVAVGTTMNYRNIITTVPFPLNYRWTLTKIHHLALVCKRRLLPQSQWADLCQGQHSCRRGKEGETVLMNLERFLKQTQAVTKLWLDLSYQVFPQWICRMTPWIQRQI